MFDTDGTLARAPCLSAVRGARGRQQTFPQKSVRNDGSTLPTYQSANLPVRRSQGPGDTDSSIYASAPFCLLPPWAKPHAPLPPARFFHISSPLILSLDCITLPDPDPTLSRQ